MWFGGHVLLVAVFGEERRDWPLWELFNFYFILLFLSWSFVFATKFLKRMHQEAMHLSGFGLMLGIESIYACFCVRARGELWVPLSSRCFSGRRLRVGAFVCFELGRQPLWLVSRLLAVRANRNAHDAPPKPFSFALHL